MLLPDWYLDLCDRVSAVNMDAGYWMEHEAPSFDDFDLERVKISNSWPFNSEKSPQGYVFWSEMAMSISQHGGEMREGFSIAEATQQLIKQNRDANLDTVPMNPPTKRREITGAELGKMQAYGYAMALYMAGCALELQ